MQSVEEQARLLRISCCRAEPILLPSGAAWLATASWEAGGSHARPWGSPETLSDSAVTGSDKERTVSNWGRESCQEQWKDQVVGVGEQTPGWVWGWGREVLLSPLPPSHLLLHQSSL